MLMETTEPPAKVLIVEDEPALLDALEYSMRKQGYQVLTAVDGRRAVELAGVEHPDLIVLDLMLPGIDGLEVCRTIRKSDNVPIIMLTALSDEIDKVVGLEVGADDYLTKPFGMRELLARVKAQLRRVRLLRAEMAGTGHQEPPRSHLVFGDLTIDKDRREVMLANKPISLRPKEFELLLFLALNRHMVLSRDLILERVWDWSYNGGSRTVDVHIRWLREKIERDPSAPVRITTVRGVGYRFEG
jgi:DNA-binding response OmpR family regulator